jgi:hypothetical protein
MHPGKREKARGETNSGKTIVAAVLERGGEVRAQVVKTRRKSELEDGSRERKVWL